MKLSLLSMLCALADSGSNLVSVTGSNGTRTFKISWDMSPAGEMMVSKIAAQAN